MTDGLTYDPAALPVRGDLAAALEVAWQRLAGCGTWWTGAERLAIAAEARLAQSCALCAERKTALSPYMVDGEHDSLRGLPAVLIDVIHRVMTDAGRLSESWYKRVIEAGLGEGEYVEAVAVVTTITALDTFDNAIGLALRPLPAPGGGAPSRHWPTGAKRNLAWVPTVAPEDLSADDIDPYAKHGSASIHRGLSLVLQEVMDFFDLDIMLYMRDEEIDDFGRDVRAISHPQIELLAGRVSALNGCFY